MITLPSLFKKKEGALGIDMGTSSVKVVELYRAGVEVRLRNYGISDIYGEPHRVTSMNQVSAFKMQERDMADMIRAILEKARIQSRLASFSIPVSSSFFTVVDFPKMDREEIEKAIPYEARKYIPVPLAEVVLSSHIIPLNTAIGAGASILLVAVPKEIIEKYKRIAQAGGITALAMEVENLSLVRSLLPAGAGGRTLLIDLGARATSISIVDGMYIRFTHHVSTAGDDFTRTITRGMSVTPLKAEALKRSTGIIGRGGEEVVSSIILPVLDIIYLEVTRILDLYEDKYPGRKIEHCVLSGGSANMPGIVDYFVEKLAVTVSVGNPFNDMLYPEILGPRLREISPLSAVAVGLAKRTLRA